MEISLFVFRVKSGIDKWLNGNSCIGMTVRSFDNSIFWPWCNWDGQLSSWGRLWFHCSRISLALPSSACTSIAERSRLVTLYVSCSMMISYQYLKTLGYEIPTCLESVSIPFQNKLGIGSTVLTCYTTRPDLRLWRPNSLPVPEFRHSVRIDSMTVMWWL